MAFYTLVFKEGDFGPWFLSFGVVAQRALQSTSFEENNASDSRPHERYCGKTNHKILENLAKLIKESSSRIQPRFPIFPGINDTDQNLTQIALLLDKLGQKRIEVLPYNPTGTYKYEALGRPEPKAPKEFTSSAELSRIQKYLSQEAK